MNEEYQKEQWLFYRNYLNTKNQVCNEFRKIEGDKLIDDGLRFSESKNKTFSIGCVYEVEVKRGENNSVSFLTSSAKFIGLWDDENLVNELRMKDRLFLTEKQNLALEKRYKQGFELPSNWFELVELYRKCNFNQKHTFEQLVIAKLQKDARK